MAEPAVQHEETPLSAEERERARREREERLQVLATTLMRTANERVSQRAHLEARWLNDLRQFNSRYDAETEARLNADETASKVFVNLTRPKVKSAKSRLIETLFPSDERNWGIRPTPVPELQQATSDETPVGPGPDGEPITVAEQASELLKEATRRAEAMELEIEDQFEESNYYSACRDVIHDGVVLGTGVLKGPVVVGRMREAWRTVTDPKTGTSVQVLERVVDKRPAVFRVDPWDFYPDLSVARLEDSESELERHWMTRKELAKIIHDPGVLTDQVKALLLTDPRAYRTTNSWLSEMREISGITSVPANDNRYEVWEYNGPIEKDDLIACGCDFVEDADNPLEMYEGTILFANNFVIKAIVNPMDTDERPYSVWCWEGDDTSIFGFGIPYQTRHPQRVVNAAWRLTLENAALSSGPQIIINRQHIAPEDGRWALTARKIWTTLSKMVNAREAFHTVDIPNNQADLMAIVAKAEQFFENETNLPLVAQGQETPGGTKTAAGLAMLKNSADTTLRDPVKNFDDDITTPTVRRFYNWNMQYNPKEHIKGDMEVRARGSSVLLVREMLAQNLMTLLATAGANPVLAQLTKWADTYRRVVSSMQMSPDDVVKSDAELKQEAKAAAENGGQPDIEQMKLEVMREQHAATLADRQSDRESRERVAAMNRDTAMMKMATDLEASLEKIAGDLERARMAEQNRRDIHISERDLRLATGAGV